MSLRFAGEAWLDAAVWERSRSSINEALRHLNLEFINNVEFGFLDLAGVKPHFQIVDIRDADDEGFEVFVEVKIESNDHEPQATVSLSLALNQPTPMIISLPVAARLLIRKIEASLVIRVKVDNSVHLSIMKPYELDWLIEMDIGDPTVHSLKRVTKVESFLYEQLQHFIDTKLVYPSSIPLRK